MFWRTFVVKAPSAPVWYLTMIEFDFDGKVTDVDEPSVSYGMDFPSRSAAVEFAEDHGIRLAPDAHYPLSGVLRYYD